MKNLISQLNFIRNKQIIEYTKVDPTSEGNNLDSFELFLIYYKILILYLNITIKIRF